MGGRTWSILHTRAVLSHADEQRFLRDERAAVPYGVVLWPAAIALAHEVAARSGAFAGAGVLELGAGTGLPGIVAASLGARVTQTDRQEVALAVCRRNGQRNGVGAITYRQADWTAWDDPERYDLILGADILYAPGAHEALRRIFATSLVPGGRVLLADPFRAVSLPALEAMEGEGWTVALSKWTVGEAEDPRAVAVYELGPPG